MEFMTKADYAYQRLRDEILSGKIPAGSKLIINDIAEQYNTSAMPIRNALTRLEEIGLVKNTPHIGARVGALDLENYFSPTLVRLDAEALATYFTTIYHDDTLIQELEELQEALRTAKCSNNLDEYSKTNRKIHMTIYNASKNSVLQEQLKLLFERTNLTRVTLNILPGLRKGRIFLIRSK